MIVENASVSARTDGGSARRNKHRRRTFYRFRAADPYRTCTGESRAALSALLRCTCDQALWLLLARICHMNPQGFMSQTRLEPEARAPMPRNTERAQSPNRSAARAFALAASSSRFFGGALVSSERRRRAEMPATSSTAFTNKRSFAFDGLVKPLIFLTNWSEPARISSSVTGGSKLNRVLIFLHMATL
jgi:hypothetical protein